jgi:hypothetical protein
MSSLDTHPAPSTPSTPDRRAWWREVGAGAALVLVNLVFFAWTVSHTIDVFQHHHADDGNANFLLSSDVGQPIVLWAWALVVGNGVLLCLRRSTRRAGVAMLVASLSLAAVLLVGSLAALLAYANGSW